MAKKLRYMAVLAAVILIASFIPVGRVKAADDIKSSQLINIGVDTDVLESPDENSNVVGNITAGTAVITQEEPENGWVKVKYKDTIGYVQTNTIVSEDSAELDQEFDQISNNNRVLFQAMEYSISQNRQKLIWGIVIVVLVVALFAVGIITALNSKKRK